MTKQCLECWEIYDWESNSAICPHVGFPRNAPCKLHARKNCGNPECEEESSTLTAAHVGLRLAGPKRKVG